MLLAELQHRVRNTLAVVRSITRRTAATSETIEDYAMHLEGRIEAFARAQAMATRSADASVDLEEFIREELLAHAVRDEDKAHVNGPSIRLRAKAADSIGLAVHELATNAVKYGALSGNGGHIDVSWRVTGTARGPEAQTGMAGERHPYCRRGSPATRLRLRADRTDASLRAGCGDGVGVYTGRNSLCHRGAAQRADDLLGNGPVPGPIRCGRRER